MRTMQTTRSNKKTRLAAALLAVMLCITAFSATAFAEEATGGMAPLTPQGSATLVDDQDYGDKQLITVTTKSGSCFYILIDRASEDKATAVYFLNQVDDADLLALLEDAPVETLPAACICTEKCQAGAVNTDCPVCAVQMSDCEGKVQETAPEPEQAANPGGILVLFLLLAVLIGGGVFAYIKFARPGRGAKTSAEPEDYVFGDEEYLNEDEQEEKL